MTYKDLIKYVFSTEGVDFMLKDVKYKGTELTQARQRSMYLGRLYFGKLSWRELGEPFKRDHTTAMHAYKAVSNLIDTEKVYKDEMVRYDVLIKRLKRKSVRVNCVSVTHKFNNKRAILRKTNQGWEIKLKRLNGRKIEEVSLNLSKEAMESIVEAYKILR